MINIIISSILKSNRKSCYEKVNTESWILKLNLSLHESDNFVSVV